MEQNELTNSTGKDKFSRATRSSDNAHVANVQNTPVLDKALEELNGISRYAKHIHAYQDRRSVLDVADKYFANNENIRDIFVTVIAGVADQWTPGGYDDSSDNETVSNIENNPHAYRIAKLVAEKFYEICGSKNDDVYKRPPLFNKMRKYDADTYTNNSAFEEPDNLGEYLNLRLQKILYSKVAGFPGANNGNVDMTEIECNF